MLKLVQNENSPQIMVPVNKQGPRVFRYMQIYKNIASSAAPQPKLKKVESGYTADITQIYA